MLLRSLIVALCLLSSLLPVGSASAQQAFEPSAYLGQGNAYYY